MFKNNSRFSSLVEDSSSSKKSVFCKKNIEKKDIEKKDKKEEQQNKELKSKADSYNNFKNEKPIFQQRDNYRRPYGRDKEFMEMLEKQERIIKDEEEKRKEKEKMESLAIESFPELVKVNSKKVSTINFLEKLNSSIKVDTPEKHIIKPGWSEMTWDPVTNSVIKKSNFIPIYVKTQSDLAYEVLDNLTYLHEKRTTEYIDKWGEDEWEKMFLFPNYDYHYFDKLDEIYEKNNPDSDEEYNQFSDEEEEYWKKY